MTEFTGGADPDKTLHLLWREELGDPAGSRGPRQKISVDEVVDAAIAMADEAGVDALSMRTLAARLEIGTMSLYTYVDSKAALIDLMIDRVLGFIPREPFGELSWRDRLERIARDQLANYLEHPWVLQVDTSRPPLGPGVSDQYEYQLSAIDGIGLGDLDMDSVITVIGNLSAAAARSITGAERVRRLSGQSDIEWWQANEPVLDRVMDATRFRVSGRVGTAFGETYQAVASPDHGFEFGLRLLLDGVEQLVQEARA